MENHSKSRAGIVAQQEQRYPFRFVENREVKKNGMIADALEEAISFRILAGGHLVHCTRWESLDYDDFSPAPTQPVHEIFVVVRRSYERDGRLEWTTHCIFDSNDFRCEEEDAGRDGELCAQRAAAAPDDLTALAAILELLDEYGEEETAQEIREIQAKLVAEKEQDELAAEVGAAKARVAQKTAGSSTLFREIKLGNSLSISRAVDKTPRRI